MNGGNSCSKGQISNEKRFGNRHSLRARLKLPPRTDAVATTSLDIEQPFLSIKTAGVTRERTAGSHHAMTRNDDRHRVSSHCTTHRVRARRTLITRDKTSTANLVGHPAVRHRRAARNSLQHAPYLKLKRRAHQMERRRIRRCVPGKIGVEPRPGVVEHGRCRTQAVWNPLAIKGRSKVCLALKPKSREPARIGSKRNHAKRRSIGLGNHAPPLRSLLSCFTCSLVYRQKTPRLKSQRQTAVSASQNRGRMFCARRNRGGHKRRGRR